MSACISIGEIQTVSFVHFISVFIGVRNCSQMDTGEGEASGKLFRCLYLQTGLLLCLRELVVGNIVIGSVTGFDHTV